MIPFFLLLLGVLFTIGIMGINIQAIVQGVLVSGAAVFANQSYKQYSSKDGDDK